MQVDVSIVKLSKIRASILGRVNYLNQCLLLSQPSQRRVQEIVLPVVICPILNPSWLATSHAQLRRLHPNFICCFMEDIDLGEGDNEGKGRRREGDDRVRKVLTTT